jgi:pSer/pThr/pTyr-binding forkhead associated (FHA) protein
MSSGEFRGPRTEPPPDDGAVTRYWVRIGRKEIPLESGETLIGRGEGCAIIVTEGLVSRRHARIVLDGGRPYLEDLGSANGTFVNLARLEGRALLFPGDLVFIGMAELEIIRRADEAPPPVARPVEVLEEDRPTPVSGVATFVSVASRKPSSSTQRTVIAIDVVPTTETTGEIEGLDYVGRLADKMLTMGRIDGALRILSGHLEDILVGARSGMSMEGKLVDSAGRYAMKLASETLDARWVNLAIELHLIMCRPLREETLQQLASLRGKVPIGDDRLILRYYERLRSERSGMSSVERLLAERVGCLLPNLDENR